MRRWLTVFLLILLPLQLSWAVAATYCAHEADPAVNHIGHHEHRHEASTPEKAIEKATEKATDKALTCVDDDCGFCHLGHSQPVASTPIVLPAMESLVTTGAAADVWSSRGPDRRERPNWLAA